MSRTATLTVLAALPIAVLSVCTLAQTPTPAPDSRPPLFAHMLKKMDANGDGRVSLDEYLATATARFKTIDTRNKGAIDAAQMANSPEATARVQRRAKALVKHLDKAGNGYITPDEFRVAATKRFARLDHNSDGKLTPDEPVKHFDKLDANHDGVVTQDEYLAAATVMYRQWDTQGTGKVSASEIASSPRAQERAAHVAAHLVKHMDSNGDGVVSQEEFLAGAHKRFTRLDKNGDGYIDADELPAHRRAHGGKPRSSGG